MPGRVTLSRPDRSQRALAPKLFTGEIEARTDFRSSRNSRLNTLLSVFRESFLKFRDEQHHSTRSVDFVNARASVTIHKLHEDFNKDLVIK